MGSTKVTLNGERSCSGKPSMGSIKAHPSYNRSPKVSLDSLLFTDLPVMKQAFASLVVSTVFLSAAARTFTVYNACPFTIWPAVFTDLNVGSAKPNVPTGWEAAAFTARSFSVPDNWKAGRIWVGIRSSLIALYRDFSLSGSS